MSRISDPCSALGHDPAQAVTLPAQAELAGRRFLLLQGPSSNFFGELGCALRAAGADVARTGFCPGDRLYWPDRAGRYIACRGTRAAGPGALHAELAAIIARENPTDIIMLGDGRAAHAAAIAVAARHPGQVQPWIVEHGYLRGGLIAIEPWGCGGRSRIPAAYAAARSAAKTMVPPFGALADPDAVSQSFLRYAAYDIAYHGANLVGARMLYPGYRPHALDGPLREYAGWIRKALRWPLSRAVRNRCLARIAEFSGPLYLFPLQLATDFQIRDHGPPEGLPDTVRMVVGSFARAAGPGAHLLITVHPLDNGWQDWAGLVGAAAAGASIPDRVSVLQGGTPADLLARVAGVVTVNSSLGLTALTRQRPVKVLGRAIYDLPGLTDPAPLDMFWTAPKAPDARELDHFIAFLRNWFHVAGSFDGPGARVGAAAIARRLAQPFPPLALRP